MATGIWRWTRADDVGIRVMIMIGVLIMAIRALWPIGAGLAGQPLSWRGQVAEEAPTPIPVIEGVSLRYQGHVWWEITDATPGQWVLALLPDLVDLIAVAAAALLLWQLVGQLRGGEPFSTTAVRSVRGLALVLAGVIGLFAVAEAFRLGAKLRADTVGLV